MRFLGIDPGVSGGLACLDDEGAVLAACAMPATDWDLLAMLVQMRGDPALLAKGVIERVSASPQMGRTSAFTFGRSYGALRMALCAAGVSFSEVRPQVWQTALGCRTGGGKLGERNVTEAKNLTKGRAQALFQRGDFKVTHAIADALLLAEYARRLQRGTVGATSGQTRTRRTRRQPQDSPALF